MTLELPNEAAYRQHYIDTLTRRPALLRLDTASVPVYFERANFDHAFFESSDRRGSKDVFSLTRARRMDDIRPALLNSAADRRVGWDRSKKRYDDTHCVTVCVADFVVIIRLGLKTDGTMKGKFVTCYVADTSIGKILRAPRWDAQACMQRLTQQRQSPRRP